MSEEYLHDEDIARLLGLGLQSLRNKISAGDPLPPNILLPGMRARIWPRREFDEWVRQFLVNQESSSAIRSKGVKARRGAKR